MKPARLLTERVYQVVARIPYGRVTTYGDIARSLGSVRGARMVGWALHAVPEERRLPCHRVVNRYGELSGGWHFGHPDVMKGLLLAEGVPFVEEYRVDLSRCLWLPWDEDEDLPAADEVDDLNSIARS
jgi:methylated-DNA-protein-cysteine methyltransferase-like protein